MSNYTHAYSQYVQHILNRSPTKTTYSFSKAQRFPRKQQQSSITDISHSKYHHEPLNNQPITSRRENSPDRKLSTTTPHPKKNREYFEEKEVKRSIDKIINNQYKQLSKTPIKSPNKKQSRPDKSISKYQKQHQLLNKQKASLKRVQRKTPSPLKDKQRSSSPNNGSKSLRKLNTHRVQTEAAYLKQTDHVSKNRTIRGYYPTGIQISPQGKYPISTIKNSTTYSFGKPIQQQRYYYLNKYSNNLGPGLYNHFSEFGPTYRK